MQLWHLFICFIDTALIRVPDYNTKKSIGYLNQNKTRKVLERQRINKRWRLGKWAETTGATEAFCVFPSLTPDGMSAVRGQYLRD